MQVSAKHASNLTLPLSDPAYNSLLDFEFIILLLRLCCPVLIQHAVVGIIVHLQHHNSTAVSQSGVAAAGGGGHMFLVALHLAMGPTRC